MTSKTKILCAALVSTMMAGALPSNAQTAAPAPAATSTNVAAAKVKPPDPSTNQWHGTTAVGLTIARGNTDTTLFSLTSHAERKWAHDDVNLGVEGLYGESKLLGSTKSTETAESLHGFAQDNVNFTDRFYGYGRVDGLHDGIADIEYRVTLAPGAGYYFIKNKVTDLSAEVGPGYIFERLDSESQSFATLRIAEKFHYAISAHARLWESIEFLPQVDNFNNYIANSELGVEASLNKSDRLLLRTVLQDTYNSIPAPGRLKNDLKLIASLVFKF